MIDLPARLSSNNLRVAGGAALQIVRSGSTKNESWDRAQPPHNIKTAPATANRLGDRSQPFQMVNSAAACRATVRQSP